jgi:tyrosyl-tRNA synthetase
LRNLAEVLWTDRINPGNFSAIINGLRIYWGTAPTGQIHIGYLIPLLKIRDFLEAGCTVIILIADIHAELDALKTSPDLVVKRSQYYMNVISYTLKVLGAKNLDKLVFRRGSDIQKEPDYIHSLYHLMAVTTEHDAKKAGTDVVKQAKNPTVGSMIYPLMQALDEVYLNCDAQLGGIDQRKIFTFAKDNLGKISFKERIHFMNPMLSQDGSKMSASDEKQTKILLTDSLTLIEKKVNKMFCDPDPTKPKNMIITLLELLLPKDDFEKVYSDYLSHKLKPQDIKILLIAHLSQITQQIRNFVSDEEIAVAYPN